MKGLLVITIGFILIFALLLGGCGESSTTPAAPATQAPAKTSAAPAATSAAAPAKTSAAPAAGTPKYGGTLTFIGDTGPGAVLGYPPEMFTAVTHWWCYNGLVKDWWNGDITPDLAESWEVDTAEPSITFHLRKGVKYHDGSTMDAEAVKFSYDLQLDANTRPAWKKWEVIDDYTVKVTLNYFDNTILRTFENEQVVSPTQFKNEGAEGMRRTPIGTGPFYFVKYDQDSLMVGKRFDDYWEEGKPYLDEIHQIYIPDKTTKKAAMQSNEGDVVLVEMGKETYDYTQMGLFDALIQPQATTFMIFDDGNEDSPWTDIKLRQAVALSIDREWLAKNLGYGQWEPCWQLPPRPSTCYDPNFNEYPRDIEKAKQLLAEAGYPNGIKTQLLPNPEGVNRDLWVAVQSQLREAGIDCDLQFMEGAKFTDLRHGAGWHDAIVADTMPSWGNMNVAIEMMFGAKAQFFPSMNRQRPDWVEAITASKATEKMDVKLVQKACQVLYDNYSVIPVGEAGRCYIWWPYVKDAGFGKRGAYFWAWAHENVWLDK
ncbi:MAG: ABC transporter substrate-binding protein [Dehalococcoidales bacterium]|nr:ABC transporter substrate-binding protein [Dehalococcoidales bacterium]